MASKTLVAAATLAARGSGGRSSVSGITATLFGSTGFLGRYVTNHLGRIGSQVTVPYRGDELNARHLKVMGDLGQVVPVPFELRDEDSIRDAIQGSSVVINVMGKNYETLNYKFHDVHVDGVRKIAETAQREGVEHFVHVSTAMPLGKCESKWLESKMEGEEIVREIFPDATIVRPTDMFGAEDRLATRMATNVMWHPFVMLSNFGEARLQPVWVNDVASVVAACVRDAERYRGKVLELGGPDVLTIREMYDLICENTQRTTRFVSLPPVITETLARVGNVRLPFLNPYPTYGGDAVAVENAELVLDRSKEDVVRFEDLDALPVSVYSDVLKETVRMFRRGGDRSSLFYID